MPSKVCAECGRVRTLPLALTRLSDRDARPLTGLLCNWCASSLRDEANNAEVARAKAEPGYVRDYYSASFTAEADAKPGHPRVVALTERTLQEAEAAVIAARAASKTRG